MCEFCGQEKTEIRRLGRNEMEPDDLCEWMPDPDELEDEDVDGLEEEEIFSMACPETPRWLVVTECVDEHMCEQHAEQERAELKDGLDGLFELAGFDPGQLRPIKQLQICDYLDPRDPTRCTNQAKFAKWVRYESIFCDEHVDEFREDEA